MKVKPKQSKVNDNLKKCIDDGHSFKIISIESLIPLGLGRGWSYYIKRECSVCGYTKTSRATTAEELAISVLGEFK